MSFKPGFHSHIAAALYHADPCEKPSLSSSIARILIEKTPAHARNAHPRLNPLFKAAATKAMDLGSVVHEIALNKGGGFEISPYDTYTTKAARGWRDDVTAAGLVPIKAADFSRANRMAEAVRVRLGETPGAERAFRDGYGEPVVIWDDIAGTCCRAMIDWVDLEQPAVFDLKTTGLGLSDRALQKAIAGGLDLQAAFHLRGLGHVKPELSRFAWHWVFVEDEEPFECRVIKMDASTHAFGDRKALYAINVWAKCTAYDSWPGYARMIEHSDYPAWAESAWLEREAAES